MQEDQETPEQETGETKEAQAQGTAENQVADSLLPEESEKNEQDEVDLGQLKAELETERKERQKVEMERNQLRNKQEEDRKKQLEEEGNFKALYEEKEAELQRIKEEAELREAEQAYYNMRDDFINQYPDERVRKAAKALVDKNPSNIIWDSNAQTEEDAKQSIHSQLDALRDTLGIISSEQEEEAPEIDGNNPYPSDEIKKSAYDNMSFQEMREVLPKSQIDK